MGRQKSDVVWLLELASLENRRPAVVHALLQMHEERGRARVASVENITKCKGYVPGVDWLADQMDENAPRILQSERGWQQKLETAQRIKPYEYKPPSTEAITPDRHPWDGEVAQQTFTEVSAGIGVFAAAFEAAGMRCVHLIEPEHRALQLAVQNCSLESATVSGLADVDPADLQWSHGLVGGPECQPFSSAGHQRAWSDPRSYTLLRTLHTMAVMKPWWVWLENVAAIETVDEGRVWRVI